MKKASIITLQYIDNCGSVLQTLATQEIIKSYAYDVEVVNFIRENCTYEYQKRQALDRYRKLGGIFAFYPVSKLLQIRWSYIVKKHSHSFNLFRKKYLNLTAPYSSLKELRENPPVADVYITGSDQVWNPEYNGGVLGEYFLDYAPKGKKRIALSASIGLEEIPSKYFEEMKSYICKYDGISVREESAFNILREMDYQSAVHVLDPTLVMTKNEWSECLKLSSTTNKYVLMYQLNDNPKMLNFAAQVAVDHNIELVIITSKYRRPQCRHKRIRNYSPKRFLELIMNAEYVVTDSFHGTAFSFNFNKEVFVFNPPKYSTRLTSILDLFHSRFRLVCDEHWRDIEKIQYDKVNEILLHERNKVYSFLAQYLK